MRVSVAEQPQRVERAISGLTVFYSEDPPSETEVGLSCWLAPEGDENGKYICARDCDLWSDYNKIGSHEDSY